MQVSGRQNIRNTLLYVQLAEELFKDQEEYVSKVARTEEEACQLVESGFDYVCDFDGARIFKCRMNSSDLAGGVGFAPHPAWRNLPQLPPFFGNYRLIWRHLFGSKV